jgi:DNA-binding transcriptional LysR family regulator
MSSIRVMKTFLAVAAEGSFAAAASRVALTQAAVGQQMRTLEADLRRPLFERQGKTVVLAEAGRQLLPQVRKLVGLYEQMLASAPAAEPMAGTVHVGAIVSAVRPLIEATLALKARHAGLELHVSAAKSADLLQRVAEGALDAAVVVHDGPRSHPGLAWTPLYDEAMVLLVSRILPEAPARTLLQQQPFIRFDRSEHTGQLVERTLQRLRARPQPFLELNALEGIVDLVRSGLGVALVPLLRDARWQADPRLRVIDLPRAEARRIALVFRTETANTAVIGAVAREFQGRLAA